MMYGTVAALVMLALSHVTLIPPQGPSLRFQPETLRVDRDTTGYVQAMIPVFALSDTLRLTGIQGSCACASASIQRSIVTSNTPGKIYIAINAKHFKDTLNTVTYTITHNGANSPARYLVMVRCIQLLK